MQGRILLGGKSIEVGTHRLDTIDQVQSVSSMRSLKEHVLRTVRQSMVRLRILGRPRLYHVAYIGDLTGDRVVDDT